jgi:hypothetical protein
LVIGNISGGQYVVRVFGTLTVIALGGFVAMNLSGWLEKVGLKTAWDGVLLQVAVDWQLAHRSAIE